jgi:hypothetical protein
LPSTDEALGYILNTEKNQTENNLKRNAREIKHAREKNESEAAGTDKKSITTRSFLKWM